MDEVAQIKANIDIVDFIGSYLSIKRSGRHFVACCPFHQEKTPSFYINGDRQSYHCFGCQKGGDIFTFLMEFESFSFKDALERLAVQAGVQLQNSGASAKDRELEKTWKKLLNFAGHYFRTQFNGELGAVARAYMSQRGFTQSTLDEFKIGYAPDSWDSLYQAALRKGFKEQDLLTMGLIKKNDRGQVFDFFRHRVIFPVRNNQGQVVAFGGRVLDKSEPKYLNSPETPLFNKSKTLFNFNGAREKLREHGHFLLMEGYTDVMMAHQFNLGPALATLGTAMTEDHIRMIRRHDSPLYLVYDADRAGRSAMERALPFVLKLGLNARAIALPNGQDPADFLLQNQDWGALWEQLKTESKDVFDYKLCSIISQRDMDQHENKIAIAKIMLKDLELNRDPLREGVYLDSIAEHLHISREDLEQQLLNKRKDKFKAQELNVHHLQLSFKKDAPYYLLSICLAEAGYRAQLDEMKDLPFYSSASATVLQKWLDAHQHDGEIAHAQFEPKLSPVELEIFSHARHQDLPEHDQYPSFFEEKCQQWLGDKNSLDEINRHIKEAEAESNIGRLKELLELKTKSILAKQ
jgi:DNA primase